MEPSPNNTQMEVERPSLLLLRQLSFLTKNSFIGAGASYFLTLTLAKYLGPTDFGVYSHIMIVGSLASVLVGFATDNTAPVLFAKTHNESAVFNAVYSVRFLFFALFLVALLAAYHSEPITALGIFATTVISLNLGFLYEVTVRNISYSYIYLFERLFYVATVLYLIYLGDANISNVFSTLLLFTAASCAWQLYANKNIAKRFSFVKISALIDIVKTNSFLVLISLSTFAYGGFSRLILEKRLGLEDLGVYSAGWQITTAITIFQAQVYRVWRIKLSKALVMGDLKALEAHIKNYLLFSTLPVVGLAMVVAYFTPQLVGLVFSHKYNRLLELLPILCLYFPIISLDGLASILWIAIGSRAQYLTISIMVSALLLTALGIFSAHLGLISFALAVIAAHGLSVTLLLAKFYTKYIKNLRAM